MYKSTDINVLCEELKNGVVTFEFTKKDGTVRTAKGTMNKEYLPEKIPEVIRFDVQAINALLEAKNITLEEYAKENGLKCIRTVFDIETDGVSSIGFYEFSPIKKKVKDNENLISYYDIEKDSFRSFIKSNFLGIIK